MAWSLAGWLQLTPAAAASPKQQRPHSSGHAGAQAHLGPRCVHGVAGQVAALDEVAQVRTCGRAQKSSDAGSKLARAAPSVGARACLRAAAAAAGPHLWTAAASAPPQPLQHHCPRPLLARQRR